MYIGMVHNILEIGKMINNMVLVQKHGQMVQGMRDNIIKEKNMEMENLIGQMDPRIMDNFKKII